MRFTTLFLLVWGLPLMAQTQTPASKADIDQLESRITQLNKQFERLTDKNIQFGLNIGYRFLTGESPADNQQATISPIDSTLQLNSVDHGSFLLSTSVLFSPRLPTKQLSENIRKQILFHLSDKYAEDGAIKISLADQLLINSVVPNAGMSITKSIDLITLFDRLDTIPYEAGTITPSLIYNFTQQLRKEIHEKKGEDDEDFERRQLRRLKSRVRTLVFEQFLIDYLIDRISIYANLNLIEFSTAQQELSFNQSIEGGLGFSYQLNPNLHVGLNWENIRTRQLQPYLQERVGQQLIINGTPVTSSDQLDTNDDDLYRNRSLSALSVKVIASF